MEVGTYQTTITYVAVAKVEPVSRIYMQDMTLAQCQKNVGTNGNAANVGDNIIVYDKRKNDGNNNYAADDEGDYTVRYINGQCWMTQNLRIEGTISATYSNFTGADFNVSAYDFKTDGGSGGKCYGFNDSGDGYNNACSSTPDNADLTALGNGTSDEAKKAVGRWYNYYATTVGTISTNSNTTPATSDICPSGWRLPTGPNTTVGTDLNILIGNTTSDYQLPTTGLNAFGTVVGGAYVQDFIYWETSGFWWSAIVGNPESRYMLEYLDSNGKFHANVSMDRHRGISIRCVMGS